MYILASWGEFLSKLKNREKFEGGLKTQKEFEETGNESPKKTGRRISTGGGNNFSGWSEYIPLKYIQISSHTIVIIIQM